MTYLLCSATWHFEGRRFPIFAGQDRRLYARLRDLCAACGVDFGEQLHAIGESKLLARHLVTYAEKSESPWPNEPETILEPCLNLGAMNTWMGTLDLRKFDDLDRRDRVWRFQHTFQEVFWILIRSGYVVNAPSDDYLEAADFVEVIRDEPPAAPG